MVKNIRIIYPASLGSGENLRQKIKELESHGFNVFLDPLIAIEPANFLESSPQIRFKHLYEALCEKESDMILCGRGGYGASDLLELLPWRALKEIPPKLIIGFSDISALHSGFFSKLGWQGLHASMPDTKLWHADDDSVQILLKILKKEKKQGYIALASLNSRNENTFQSGWLFGGCLSVLCNLIGTKFFPKSLDNAFLFLEDIHENPGKIFRCWNQLRQSKVLKGVSAVILGQFTDLESSMDQIVLKRELATRCDIPVFSSDDFGHVSRNFPLMIGAKCFITEDRLTWVSE